MKQLTFPGRTLVTRINLDGSKERLCYGKFEAVMIVTENGMPVNRISCLMMPRHPVIEVECVDGSKLLFDEPFYCIEEKGYGIKAYLTYFYGEMGYHEKVSEIAKRNWQEAGRPEGQDEDFWFEAEKELEDINRS